MWRCFVPKRKQRIVNHREWIPKQLFIRKTHGIPSFKKKPISLLARTTGIVCYTYRVETASTGPPYSLPWSAQKKRSFIHSTTKALERRGEGVTLISIFIEKIPACVQHRPVECCGANIFEPAAARTGVKQAAAPRYACTIDCFGAHCCVWQEGRVQGCSELHP